MPTRSYGGGTKERFTSKEHDAEAELDYFGARTCMAAPGRWTAVDPLAALFPGWSPYNYELNNPVSLVDPEGMTPCGSLDNPVRRRAARGRGRAGGTIT